MKIDIFSIYFLWMTENLEHDMFDNGERKSKGEKYSWNTSVIINRVI